VAQAIGQVLEIFGVAAFVALATALCLMWLGQRHLPAGLTSRVVLPGAIAIAYFAGYAVLPRSFASFVPQQGQSWPWLPYLGFVAAAISAVFPYFVRISTRLIALITISGMAGALLSPTWAVYGFTRDSLGIFLAFYLLAIGLPLLNLLSFRSALPGLWFLLTIAILNTLAIGANYGIRHAQLAALPAGALMGVSLALRAGPKDAERAFERLAPVFVTLVGGIAWLACVEPDPPQPILLAIPLLTWAIWLPRLMMRLPSAPKGIG
jgi:hypothetical protein